MGFHWVRVCGKSSDGGGGGTGLGPPLYPNETGGQGVWSVVNVSLSLSLSVPCVTLQSRRRQPSKEPKSLILRSNPNLITPPQLPFSLKYNPNNNNNNNKQRKPTYLGRHYPVVTEFRRDEGLGGRTRAMSYVNGPAVHSFLIATELQGEKQRRKQGEKERGRNKKERLKYTQFNNAVGWPVQTEHL